MKHLVTLIELIGVVLLSLLCATGLCSFSGFVSGMAWTAFLTGWKFAARFFAP